MAPTPASSIGSRCLPSIGKPARIAWQRTATVATPHEGYHRVYGSFASNSPVTDGTRVFAFFGSRGLYAYDVNGTPLWQKDFGVQMRMDMAFGEGTPLTLHDGRLLLHFDHLDTGFLVMLDPVDRPGDLADEAHRAVQLGRALRRPAQRPPPDHRQRVDCPQLRLRDRRRSCGRPAVSARTPSRSRCSTRT